MASGGGNPSIGQTTAKNKAFTEKIEKQLQDEHNEAVAGLAQSNDTWLDIINSIPQLSTTAYDQYMDLANKYGQNDYFYNRGSFDYDKDITDFLDPNTNTLVAEAGNATKKANPLRAGYGLDTDVATSKTNEYTNLFNEAKNDWTSDRDYRYNVWKDAADAEQTKLDYENAQAANSLNTAKQLADWENEKNNMYMQTLTEYQKAMADSLATNGLTWDDIGGNPYKTVQSSSVSKTNNGMTSTNIGI